MSLARMLLNGVTESTVEGTKYMSGVQEMANGMSAIIEDEPTCESWTDAAMESMISDLYSIDKAYHVADIIGEVKVMTEGAQPEVLMEGMVKSGIAKIKEAFNKFWAKIKSWFAGVKRQLMLIFKTGKDFIKQFKTELDKKSAKGYIYSGYKYDITGGDAAANAAFDKVMAKVDEYTGELVTVEDGKMSASAFDKAAAETQAKDVYAKLGLKEDQSQTEFQDEFIKGLGVKGNPTTIDELRTELTNIYHGGDDKPVDIEDFEGPSKDEMIKFVDGFDKKIKAIETAESKFDAGMKKIISSLDKVEKKNVGDAGFKQTQIVSRHISALLAIGKVPSGVQQAIYKEANGQFERALKGYLRFKPAKEGCGSGYEDDDEMDDLEEGSCGKKKACENLLEQAMNLFI